jgi:DNA repair protein RecO (recombination protein O)
MFQTEAYILFAEPIGEADRRYILLTKEVGKLAAWARGVRKHEAKLAGHLEPPNASWVSIIDSSRGWQITQALERTSFPEIRNNSEAMKAVMRAAKFVLDFIPETSREVEVASLWEEFLLRLEKGIKEKEVLLDPAWLEAQFFIKGLATAGFFPSLDLCANCGKAFGKGRAYLKESELLCESCASQEADFILIPKTRDVLSVIRGGVWLHASDQSEAVKRFTTLFLSRAKRFML